MYKKASLIDFNEYVSQLFHSSKNLSGHPELWDKMIDGGVTPTTVGTTTVVTTTASSGNYARCSTSTTTSLPSTCPGIVQSRQQNSSFLIQEFPQEIISSNGFLGMEIYSPGVPQVCDTLLECDSGEVDQLAETISEVEHAMECCKSRCEIVLKEIERVKNSNEIDPKDTYSNYFRVELEEMDEWENRMEKLDNRLRSIPVQDGEIEKQLTCSFRINASKRNCKRVRCKIEVLDALVVLEVQEFNMQQVAAQVPQVLQNSTSSDIVHDVSNSEMESFPQIPNKVTVDDDLRIIDKNNDTEMRDLVENKEYNGNVESNNISELERIDLNEFSESEKEDLVNENESGQDNSDVDNDGVSSYISYESELNKNKAETYSAKNVFNISEKETKDQQEQLLQLQVQQLRLGVLKLVQACLGQHVIMMSNRYGSEHRLNYKWQNSWRGSLPDFWPCSASSSYGT